MARRREPPGPPAGNLLTTRDVALLLRVHPKHVYRLMRRGLPALRVGDEWRFDRESVLSWAAARSGAASPDAGGDPQVPGLLAANGDLVVDALLAQRATWPGKPLGFVLTDHSGGAQLLQRHEVLVAGGHGGLDAPSARPNAKVVRLQLVTREAGLAAGRGVRVSTLGAAAGKRLAIRPSTAGLRRRLDDALRAAGIAERAAYRHATEHPCHRDVALAVARGDADLGLTTHAWAQAAGLSFFPLAVEEYDLCFLADSVDDPRVVALCEAAQSAAFRKRVRACAGYDASKAGRVRPG